jgi:RHS repeat-associated protein
MRPAYPIASPTTRFFCLLLYYALTLSLFAPVSPSYRAAASSVKKAAPAARVTAPALLGEGASGKFNVEPPRLTRGSVENLPNLNEVRKRESYKPQIHKSVINGVCPAGVCFGAMMPQSGSVNDPDFSTARRRPENETGASGVDLGSRNFNWSLPILSLPGRAGLDLDLTVYYNSLVWTKQGTNTRFGLNRGFPGLNGVDRAPGFELHLPYLQQRYQNQDYGLYAYMLVMPSGGRVEFRRVGTSNIYESEDSSYAQLTDNGTGGATIRMRDGTLYTFGWNEITTSQWGQQSVKSRRCTQIKDRNGNFITAAYNTNGALISITDTLGRVINFNYDPTMNVLTSITQTRNGTTFTWATFSYGIVNFSVNFVPPDSGNNSNGAGAQVLTQINLPDGSFYGFNYNTYAQVYRITRYAPDGHTLSYINYNLPLDASVQQSDCPRFTEQRVWAENWNNNQGVVTNYAVAPDGSWSQVILPDGTPSNPNDNVVYREYFATTGWQKGLPTRTETFLAGAPSTFLKWTTTSWTQDDESLSYQKNPRPTESNVYDAEGNRRRTTISYTTFSLSGGTSCSLPADVYEYNSDATSVLRRTHTDYRYDADYLERRIIGLVDGIYVYDGGGSLASKVRYDYDWPQYPDLLQATPAQATQHDTANYGQSFCYGRGNKVWEMRYDVTDPNNTSKGTDQIWKYYTTGAVIYARDASGHAVNISYADSFSDSVNHNTFAYPTTVTDADNFSSTTQYNYDFGAVTRTQDPKGVVATMQYDAAGRIERVTNQFNGAYTRWVYPASQTYLRTVTKVNAASPDEFSSEEHFDGMGRVRLITTQFPGSAGGSRVSKMEYDAMGRVARQSNPTETDGNWNPAGDDAAGMQWTQHAYDWNGRPTLTTNPDGTTRELTYGGCGCAGGQIVTARDERGRGKRMTMDVNGLLKKVEELNWDQSVYSTTNYTYNARNQITLIDQMGQTRTFEYDGHGRLWKKTTPEQGQTTYSYFADDTVQTVQDARGATSTFGYNGRHLVTGISYGVPAGVAATANVSYGYDAAGNRTSMTDGLGSVSYQYNTLSQLESETRTFTGVVGSYTLSYAYNLAGQLTSLNNQSGAQVGYSYDYMGQMTAVTGAGYAGVSTYASGLQYRAFGGLKQMSYGNGRTLSIGYNNRLLASQWNVSGVLGYSYSYGGTYLNDNTGRVTYAHNLYDSTLDRSFDYDQLGRLVESHSGAEARAHIGQGQWSIYDGPYSQVYSYDQWGNLTQRQGWGGENASYTASFTNNRRSGSTYDAMGNVTNAGGQSFSYDATGQQTYASVGNLQQSYDGDRLRGRKVENGATTYYLRSSVLGGQVVAEISSGGAWMRGYVYAGSQMVAIQDGGVYWTHQDPVTKSQRVTNSTGTVVSWIELDPWGGETNRSSNQAFQPHRFTTYERDGNQSDEAMFRRYNRWWSRFDQPDPYDGSYNLSDPQSFNRYSYTQNDPVNFTDPSGLDALSDSISSVRNALRGGMCRSLFGSTDPNKLLDLYANNNLIRVGKVFYLAVRDSSGRITGNRTELFQSMDDGGVMGRYAAARDYDGDGILESIIAFNENGFSMTGLGTSGFPVNRSTTGGLYGLNLSQIRGVSLIHELLHVIRRIPNDSNDPSNSISERNSALVSLMCFSSLNNPDAPIPQGPLNINTNPIPLRPLSGRPGVGGGGSRGGIGGGGGVGGVGALTWLSVMYRLNGGGYSEVLGYRLNPPR